VVKKDRTPIPASVAALVQFLADRTCCVCRKDHQRLQIHHIDDNPANNEIVNLAPLCLACHDQTQIKGGFGRALDSEQVRLYRNDWLEIVSRRRTIYNVEKVADALNPVEERARVQTAVAEAEAYRKNEDWELLAMHYASVGHADLQAEYTARAIEQGVSDESYIYLRKIQNRVDLIPHEVIDREIARITKEQNWAQLGRLYRTLRRFPECVKATCQSIIEDVDDNRVFVAAFYLKEMLDEQDHEELFMLAFDVAQQSDDLWRSYRCLEELGWEKERLSFLLEHQVDIQQSGNLALIAPLQAALGNVDGYREAREKLAHLDSAKDHPQATEFFEKRRPSAEPERSEPPND
jgi:hypothetical protein